MQAMNKSDINAVTAWLVRAGLRNFSHWIPLGLFSLFHHSRALDWTVAAFTIGIVRKTA